MNQSLSPNTQAILLLTAPLAVGRRDATEKLLTPGEYMRLARHLHHAKQQPADLLSREADSVLEGCQSIANKDRLQNLLKRGFLLSLAIERWSSRAIWVVSRADATYPRRLKTVMREAAPAIFYGCGEKRILNTSGLAVVGSRDINDSLVQYAESIGRLAARSDQTLVSGNARGTDQAAMRGALKAGGNVVGVIAGNLEQAAMNRDNRSHLMENRLVLVSPYDPSAGFHAGNAMQRNKLIYAFSNAALVVNSDINRGGTWAGAIEQLNKLHFVPVYVRSTGQNTEGLDALRKKGAIPWPNPESPEDLVYTFRREPLCPGAAPKDLPLLDHLSQKTNMPLDEKQPHEDATQSSPSPASDAPNSPSEDLFSKVRDLLLPLLKQPKKEKEIAASLQVNPTQARDWLKRLVKEGFVERRERPVSYQTKPNGGSRPSPR